MTDEDDDDDEMDDSEFLEVASTNAAAWNEQPAWECYRTMTGGVPCYAQGPAGGVRGGSLTP